MILEARIDSHQELIDKVNAFLDGKTDRVPGIGLGRFEGRAYKAALVVDRLYQSIDEIISEASAKAAGAGHPVTCRKGCSACCYQPVVGPIAETFLIAEYLEVNPELKEKFLKKYPPWRKQVNPKKYTEQMNQLTQKAISCGAASEKEIKSAVQIFSSSSPPCPFLESNDCSIYPARPFACRQLLALDDPKKCQTGERMALFKIGSLYHFINRKGLPLMSKILQTFEINVLMNDVLAVSVYEYLENGGKYFEFCAELVKQKLGEKIKEGMYKKHKAKGW